MFSLIILLPCLPIAELVAPYLPRVGLGKGANEFDGTGILVGGGHPFDMLLQLGYKVV
jgi:hypothetical protein